MRCTFVPTPRASRLLGAGLLAASLFAPSVQADTGNACHADTADAPPLHALMSEMLDRPGVRARVSSWGRDEDEIRHDLSRLTPSETGALRCLLEDMLDQPSVERDALFLVVVSLMREQRLYRNLTQYSRR